MPLLDPHKFKLYLFVVIRTVHGAGMAIQIILVRPVGEY